MTRLPWITLIVAAIVVFNPLGWEIIGKAIRYTPTDWLRDLWVIVTLTGAAILTLMACIEIWYRGRRQLTRGRNDQAADQTTTRTET